MEGSEAERSRACTFHLPCEVEGIPEVSALLDTGATVSVISDEICPSNLIQRGRAVPVKVANGAVSFCEGRVTIQVLLGEKKIPVECLVMGTEAFDLVIGCDFVHGGAFKGLLVDPDRILLEGGGEVLISPVAKEVQGKIFRVYYTEAYQLLPKYKQGALLELKLPSTIRNLHSLAPTAADDDCPGNEIITSADVDLFASLVNRNENLFCCKANSAWKYDWGRLGLT